MASGAKTVEQEIKDAINANDADAINQWLVDYPNQINSKIILGSGFSSDRAVMRSENPLQYAARNGREPAARALIVAGADATDALQDAGRRRDAQAVRTLIAAGVKVTASLNEYTQKFKRPDGVSPQSAPYHQNLFEQMLAVCEKAQSHDPSAYAPVKLQTEIRNMEALFSKQEWAGMEQFILERKDPQMRALWDVMQLFQAEFTTYNGDYVKLKKLCSDFLYRVALLSSSPLLQAANTLGVLANTEADSSQKSRLIRIQKVLEQHVQAGQTNSYAQSCVHAQVMRFAANKDAANLPDMENWAIILDLPLEAWEVLGQLQNQWVESGSSDISPEQLSNIWVLADTNLVKFLKNIVEKITGGEIERESPACKAMLTALHTLFQRNPELKSYRVIQSAQPTAASLSDAEKMSAVSAEINALYDPPADLLDKVDVEAFSNLGNRMDPARIKRFERTPPPASDITHTSGWKPPSRPPAGTPNTVNKRERGKGIPSPKKDSTPIPGAGGAQSPKVPGAVHTIGEPPEPRRVEPSYKADYNPLDPSRKAFLHKPPYELQRDPVGRLPKRDTLSTPKEERGAGTRWTRPSTKGGAIGAGTVLPDTDQDRLSSFYYAAKRIYERLTTPGVGYKYFSLPEMELFQTIKELLKDRDALQTIIIDGKTIWDTLNPEGVGVFKVSQLIEAENGETQSPLEKAMVLHEQYKQEFKTRLSQPGGTYKPANKNYYIERGIDNRYHLMVKGGKILSEQEKEEAIRELLIITRDMENKIDVNVQIHSAVSVAEAKDLAAIITVLGAKVDKTQNVAEKDKSVHKAVEDHATKMQETAIAPEFAAASVKGKQKELWQTVRRKGVLEDSATKAVQISAEIKSKDYRLMSADGVRKVPEFDKVIEEDKRAYWEKKNELLSRPGWNYIDASDIVTNVLRSVKEEVPLKQKSAAGVVEAEIELSDGVVAHLMPFTAPIRDSIRRENLTRSHDWPSSKTQRSEQYSDDNSESSGSDSENECLAPDRDSKPTSTVQPKHRGLSQASTQAKKEKRGEAAASGHFMHELKAKIRTPKDGGSSSETLFRTDLPPTLASDYPRTAEQEAQQLATAIADSLRYNQQKAGPRALSGFKFKTVGDDGNCFYYALAAELQKGDGIEAFSSLPEDEPLHTHLRRQVEGDDYEDKRWVDQKEIEESARQFHRIIAIVDTRHPDLGFYCCWDIGGEIQWNLGREGDPKPPNRPIVRLAYTGDHYMPVESHRKLNAEALREKYPAPSSVHQSAPVSHSAMFPSVFPSVEKRPSASTGAQPSTVTLSIKSPNG